MKNLYMLILIALTVVVAGCNLKDPIESELLINIQCDRSNALITYTCLDTQGQITNSDSIMVTSAELINYGVDQKHVQNYCRELTNMRYEDRRVDYFCANFEQATPGLKWLITNTK